MVEEDEYQPGLKQAFARAAAIQISNDDFLEAVLDERPDLREKIDSGALIAYSPRYGNAPVAIVGDEVFKGALFDIPDFDMEHQLMTHMEGRDLLVPKVTCVGEKSLFFGMEKMPGIVLGRGLQEMTSDEQEKLARQIGKAVAGIAKAFTDEEAMEVFKLRQPTYPHLGECREALQNADVRAALGNELLAACEKVAEEYAQALLVKKPIVMNLDLHPANGFVDPETKELTGLIDFEFSNMMYCFPEFVGVNRLLKDYPQTFVKAVCEEAATAGVPLSYRHVMLDRAANAIGWLPSIFRRKEKSPDSQWKSELSERIGQIKETMNKLAEMDNAPARAIPQSRSVSHLKNKRSGPT